MCIARILHIRPLTTQYSTAQLTTQHTFHEDVTSRRISFALSVFHPFSSAHCSITVIYFSAAAKHVNLSVNAQSLVGSNDLRSFTNCTASLHSCLCEDSQCCFWHSFPQYWTRRQRPHDRYFTTEEAEEVVEEVDSEEEEASEVEAVFGHVGLKHLEATARDATVKGWCTFEVAGVSVAAAAAAAAAAAEASDEEEEASDEACSTSSWRTQNDNSARYMSVSKCELLRTPLGK